VEVKTQFFATTLSGIGVDLENQLMQIFSFKQIDFSRVQISYISPKTKWVWEERLVLAT
jgi:hypothetical protein